MNGVSPSSQCAGVALLCAIPYAKASGDKRGTEPKPSPPMRVTPASVIGEELSSPATEAASPDLRFPTEDEDHSLRALAIRVVDQLLE
jgi:hypothetical protein